MTNFWPNFYQMWGAMLPTFKPRLRTFKIADMACAQNRPKNAHIPCDTSKMRTLADTMSG